MPVRDEWVNEFHSMRFRIFDVQYKLEANLETHQAQFEKAVEGFRRHALRELEARIDDIKEGRDFDLGFRLPRPEDHTLDYRRVITMLSMSAAAGEEYVVLSQSEVAQYIMDDWGWSELFTSTSMFYAASAE